MNKKRLLLIFLLGFLSFFLSQILIRIPILNMIFRENPKFIVFQINKPVLFGLLLAFSAGLLEEFFRFLFFRFIIRSSNKIIEPIIFGFGHSFMEVLYIFTPLVLTYGISSISSLAIIERFLATVFHIEMTIIIWLGFKVNKKYLCLFIAVFLHFSMDALIPISRQFGMSVLTVELLFAIIIVMVGFIIYSLIRRRDLNEKV